MKITKGKWKARQTEFGDYEIVSGAVNVACAYLTQIEPGTNGNTEANATLIVSAVNACVKVNPDSPIAVAEGIADLYEACKMVMEDLYTCGFLRDDTKLSVELAVAKVKGK